MRKSRGFSLFEMIIVMAIAGLVLSSATIVTINNMNKTKFQHSINIVVNEIESITDLYSRKEFEVYNENSKLSRWLPSPVYKVSAGSGTVFEAQNIEWTDVQRRNYESADCGPLSGFNAHLGALDVRDSIVNFPISCNGTLELLKLRSFIVERESGATRRPFGNIRFQVELDASSENINFVSIRDYFNTAFAERGIAVVVWIYSPTGMRLVKLDDVVSYTGDLKSILTLDIERSFSEGYLTSNGRVLINRNDAGLCWDTRNPTLPNLSKLCIKSDSTDSTILNFVDQDDKISKIAAINTLAPISTTFNLTGDVESIDKRECPDGYKSQQQNYLSNIAAVVKDVNGQDVIAPVHSVKILVDDVNNSWAISSVVKSTNIHQQNLPFETVNNGVSGYLVQECVLDI
ncbi:type II secretion system GspH family protein [Shewanella sp. D64]|uniref:type II secretion system protein n=1 Tax=unclassified Shewanella TaxID=196818 RepID=UPI0022BA5B20|nr:MULTISPECIES: prepilin-type N-terminal cleavage/methylation domain-containing protein [unclassified Shewanella]MEC4724931.1 type II secretion system GspH family protein [Shewanella sp. D64]MEC4736276.1 type II secretion system GspH family protein [Shewanella sp. E94]WBJ97660.1 type II secretion system GspH family protein [Shewanella sp. MTB7]